MLTSCTPTRTPIPQQDADYGLALVAWLVAALACRRPWRGWMVAACGMSIIAAVVQQLRWGLSDQFNHNDLYHVIQAGALYFFYRATLRLGEGVVAPNPPPLSAPRGVLQGAGTKGPPRAMIPPRRDCLDTGGRGRFIEIHHHENSTAFPFVGNVCLGHPAAGSDLDLRRWNQ